MGYVAQSIKLKDTFNVKDYGAIADSSGSTGNGTDNATAIQSAITAAIANGGGVVQLNKGIYRYTTALTCYGNNVTIRGLMQKYGE